MEGSHGGGCICIGHSNQDLLKRKVLGGVFTRIPNCLSPINKC